MSFLHGEYECKVDAKGRLKMPASMLRQLNAWGAHSGEGDVVLYVNRGFEKCLLMYPEDVWQSMVSRVSKLNLYRKQEREFVRYFFRGLNRVQVDSAERISVGKVLLDYAQIEKEVVVFAYLDRIELWDKATYAEVINEEPSDFSLLAEQVFGENDEESP